MNIKDILPEPIFEELKSMYSIFSYFKYKDLFSNNIKLKNMYKGKRCFILGSGPSIKQENLKPLKNEILFALNNFYVHEDYLEIMDNKDIDKFHMTAPIHKPQTEEEWTSWFTEMNSKIPLNVNMIFGLNHSDLNIYSIIKKEELFKEHRIWWYFASKRFKQNNKIDLTKPLFTAEAVSLYAIQAAIYMGFDEIYLLGMDHDYFLYENESEMRMYNSAKHQNNELSRTFGDDFYIEEFHRQYKIFKKYKILRDNTNSKIYNATKGGILRVFQRVDFKNLFSKEF